MPRPGTQPAQEPSSSRPLSPKRTTQTSEPVPQPIEVARNHRSRDPEEGNRRINEQKPTSLAIPHSPLAKDLERKQRVREAARKRQQRHRLAVRQRRLLEVEARLVGSSDIAGTHQNHPTTPLTPYPDLLSDEEHTTATSNSDYVQTSGNSLPASTHGHSQQLDIAHLESSSVCSRFHWTI
ncbi:hypothetical protein FA15DRAFT_355937 [Coprinopsis marcescibilis]|uniref:Uncharacterized protein n=1 Tax=Coprinopsis marcescibilis TaxID=230819 RepID=A0A5C3KBA9_COPMA|nr:hypothetical protein FA15DRAFT_355937 [Coprinopsis marcescibilis]